MRVNKLLIKYILTYNCDNYVPKCIDELSSTMSWVGCLLEDSELFILFTENGQILLKIRVIPIFLTFIYLKSLVNNQLNSSSNWTHHCCTWLSQMCLLIHVMLKSHEIQFCILFAELLMKYCPEKQGEKRKSSKSFKGGHWWNLLP